MIFDVLLIFFRRNNNNFILSMLVSIISSFSTCFGPSLDIRLSKLSSSGSAHPLHSRYILDVILSPSLWSSWISIASFWSPFGYFSCSSIVFPSHEISCPVPF